MSRVLLAFSLVILLAAPAALAQDDKKAGADKPKLIDKPRVLAPAQPRVVEVPQPRVVEVAPAQFAKPERKVYRVKHVSAVDLGDVLEQVLRGVGPAGEGAAGKANAVAIVAEPVANRLVISGPAKVIEEIVDLIEDLDCRPAMVQIRALVAEISTDKAEGMLDELSASAKLQSIDELAAAIAKRPGLRVLGCPQITVQDNEPGFLHLGSAAPRITGITISPAGQTNQISTVNVGLILSVRVRTSPEGLVTMEVDLNKSQLGPEEEGTPISIREGKTTRTPAVETLKLQTTVGVRSGQTLLLAGVGSKSEARRTELIILISPRIVKPK